MSETYDVVIIGGGLGGLIAAHLLQKERSGINIRVLEASDKVCGSLRTLELESANGKDVYDVGVSRVGSAHPLMLSLLKELGIETQAHYDKGTKHWQLPDGKIKTYSGAIPPLAYTALVDLLRYFRKMDKIAEKINLNDVASTENCSEYENTTVEAFLNKFLWTQGAKDMASTMVGTFCNMPPSQINLLSYGYLIKTCGNWEKHVGGEGTGRMDLKFKGGCQQLGERLLEKVGKDRVVFSDAVMRIEQQSDMSGATIHTKSGKTYNTKRVIISIPSLDMCKIDFTPRISIPRTLPFGDYTTHFVVTYKKCFWREKKMAGELLSMAGTLASFKNETTYPLIAFFDHTSANGNPALMGIFSSLSYAKMTKEERKSIAVDFIASVLGAEAKDFVDYGDVVWSRRAQGEYQPQPSEEFKSSQILDSLAKPHGCIHFAGEETGTVWLGMMESAAQASTRAVREVIAAL